MPELGFGTATLGRECGEDDSLGLLDAAYERGIRHFDTAEAYGGGNARLYRRTHLGVDDVREKTGLMHSSEILLGRWIRSRGVRPLVEAATKVSSASSHRQILAALEASLERLRIDTADVYYLHSLPDGDHALEEALTTLDQARQAGLVKAAGVCNCSEVQLKQVCRLLPSIAYCQCAWNLVVARQASPIPPLCRQQGIRFVGYSPLAAGFLTGKYGARGESVPAATRFDVIPGHQSLYFHEESFAALQRLQAASQKTGVACHMLAMAWALRTATVSLVLVGATRVEHLDNAVRAQALSRDEEFWASLPPLAPPIGNMETQ